jgi:hypothetical protein
VLEWNAADDGGSEITGFELQIDSGVDMLKVAAVRLCFVSFSLLTRQSHAMTPSVTLVSVYEGLEPRFAADNLHPGFAYQARVRCSNSTGWSEFSPIALVSTLPTSPEAAEHLSVKGKPRQTAVDLQWIPPSFQGGSAVTAYLFAFSFILFT